MAGAAEVGWERDYYCTEMELLNDVKNANTQKCERCPFSQIRSRINIIMHGTVAEL